MSGLRLPPLPPTGGEITGRNVVDVLDEQHRELVELCARWSAETGERRHTVAGVVVATLSRHLSAEEQYLYPAIRRTVPEGDLLADRELAEDHDLLRTLAELNRAADDRSDALIESDTLIEEVTAAVRRHVEADTSELLPLLTRMVPVEDLIRLGNRLETAVEAAPTRPHPATPCTPPWNKIVDPVVAIVDKARDAMSGRISYPGDL